MRRLQSGATQTFTYQRPANRTDINYAVEVSTDLRSWTSVGVTHQRTLPADANGMETWQGSCSSTGPKLFFRLHVTQP